MERNPETKIFYRNLIDRTCKTQKLVVDEKYLNKIDETIVAMFKNGTISLADNDYFRERIRVLIESLEKRTKDFTDQETLIKELDERDVKAAYKK